MAYVTKAQIEQAKQMDLLTYLQTCEPQELIHVRGDVYCTRTHDSLKISHGKWCWWSRHIGGRSALDYLIKVKGEAFTDAVERLCNVLRYTPPGTPSKSPVIKRRFDLPEADRDNDRVIAYLLSRGIDAEILSYCFNSGRLYQSKRYKNAVFVGFDRRNIPRYTSLRGTAKGSQFMLDLPGSDKRYSFSIPPKEQSDKVYLFESAIDLMSYASIMNLHGEDWQSINYLSMGGVYLPRENMDESTLPLALAQYLKDYPCTRSIVLCLDNDLAGREAAKAIATILEAQYIIENKPPPQGKDYNELLQIKKGIRPMKMRNDITR